MITKLITRTPECVYTGLLGALTLITILVVIGG